MVILVLCPLVNNQLVKNELRTNEGWLGQMMQSMDDITCCHDIISNFNLYQLHN